MSYQTHVTALADFEQGEDASCTVSFARGCIVFPYDPPPMIGLAPMIGLDFWLTSTEHWLSDDANDTMNGYHCDWPLYVKDGSLLTSANPPR